MRRSTARFETTIDPRHDASRSIVLRYRDAFRFGETDDENERFKALLERCSIAEGVRLVPLVEYRGVEIHVLDETSAMYTGTLKSIDGCVTIARCLEEGLGRIVFESGGNTGSALAEYAARVGIETFCFVPAENLPLLDGRTFAPDGAHLIAVDDPAMVREAAERFASVFQVARVPRVEWRIAASRFLGCFVHENLIGGARFDWLVQTISAGFGPIGIYQVLADEGGRDGAREMPRFLGVQQAANCAMFRAWRAGSAELAALPVRSTAKLLSPVMYDSRPQKYGTFRELARLIDATRGSLTTVDHEEFDASVTRHMPGGGLLELLAERGLEIARRDGEIIERTGLLALVGALKEIDAGTIAPGSRVLCCLTSGTGTPDGRAVPDFRIRDLESLAREAGARWFSGAAHA